MSELIERIPEANEFIRRFDSLITQAGEFYEVETIASRVHVLHPRKSSASNRNLDKDVSLTVSAVIHGVEVGGLAVIVKFLELVTRGEIKLNSSMGVALGNVEAVQKATRFVDRDLNRSFGRAQLETVEDRRAKDLEALFTRSNFLIDMHQVRLKIDRVFWIFPFTRKSYDFARLVAPEISVITHWGKGFSSEGKCSDEWVNEQGGIGVTIELGQNGFADDQVQIGVSVVKRAVSKIVNLEAPENQKSPATGPLFTWGEIIPYPATSVRVLDEGMHNFKCVTAGERVGVFEGKEILATVSGPVLFPKYPEVRPDGSTVPIAAGSELIRIMKEITEDQLPK